jgi:hypothetical protein
VSVNAKEMYMTLPNAQSEFSTVMEFENQEWVKNIAQADQTNVKKKHVDPNAAFPFQDDFLVRTIHGKNEAVQPKDQVESTGAKDATKVIKITKNNKDISVLTSKTQEVLPALLAQERSKSKSTVGTQVASGSNSPVNGLTDDATPTRATGIALIAAEGPSIPPSTGTKGKVDGRPGGK